MDTLVAGYRRQKDGPVSQSLITYEDDATGAVGIDLAVFDENAPTTGQESSLTEGLVSRSFITIPAGLMDQIVMAWKERHPEGVAEQHYGDLETSVSESSEPAARFVSGALGA